MKKAFNSPAVREYTHKDVLNANRDYYDKAAEDYRQNEKYAYSKEIVEDVTRIMQDALNSLGMKKLFLDIGCGSGFLSEVIFGENMFEFSAGIDISEYQVDLFNRKFNVSNFKGVVGDITCLPYPDKIFDMAGSYSVLHHVIDYKAVIEEVTRVLKPGGILYTDFEPNKKFRKLMSIPLSIRRHLMDKAPQDLDQLERLAEYHHNIGNGIDRHGFVAWLEKSYEVLEVGPRFPQTASTGLLKLLYNMSWSFAPYFYVVAQRR